MGSAEENGSFYTVVSAIFQCLLACHATKRNGNRGRSPPLAIEEEVLYYPSLEKIVIQEMMRALILDPAVFLFGQRTKNLKRYINEMISVIPCS